jgi:hypothetical protein
MNINNEDFSIYITFITILSGIVVWMIIEFLMHNFILNNLYFLNKKLGLCFHGWH